MTTTLPVLEKKSAEWTEAELERFAELARALGHPHRVAILSFLMQTGACMCGDIVKVLPVAQSTVSQHLKKLKDAGWIQGEIEGPRVCYCLKPEVLEELKIFLTRLCGAAPACR